MQFVRQAEGSFKEIRYLQNLLQDSCPERPDTWRYKIKLVEVCNYDDRSDCRYAY